MLKVQAVLHDGSVALEFLTDDIVKAEEMRVQFLDFNRAGEVRVLDEPEWFAFGADVRKGNRPENPRYLRTHCSSFICHQKGRNSERFALNMWAPFSPKRQIKAPKKPTIESEGGLPLTCADHGITTTRPRRTGCSASW
jgi:hypothetical protein